MSKAPKTSEAHASPQTRNIGVAPPERDLTDESLRLERVNADHALTDRQSAEQAADKAVHLSRHKADEVVENARERQDQKIQSGTSADGGAAGSLDKERSEEDHELKRDRATADALLKVERKISTNLNTQLLAERTKTDTYLLSERDQSDLAVSHRDDFLGYATHDLLNHLNSIYLESALSQAQATQSADRKIVETMQRIQRRTTLMKRIVLDLADVASIEAGKLAIRPALGNIAALLAAAADHVVSLAGEKSISLSVSHGDEAHTACFDYERILQVLNNLLSNAIKFTPAHGAVEIRCECVGEELRLIVSDNGPGIPADMLQSVFEQFWQVGKNDRRGRGLGLYISRGIVESHGGTIWVESELGKGSTFIAAIPRDGRRPSLPLA